MGGVDTRVILQRQLAISWSFAGDFILGRIGEDLALWEPSPGRAYTVRRTDGIWRADWPDERNDPPRTATIGWLLWHIEWWWSDTLALVDGRPRVGHQEHVWSGGTRAIEDLKRRWDAVLAEDDLERGIQWVMAEPQPLGMVAAWVNFELTKNLAEINQIRMWRAAGVTSH